MANNDGLFLLRSAFYTWNSQLVEKEFSGLERDNEDSDLAKVFYYLGTGRNEVFKESEQLRKLAKAYETRKNIKCDRVDYKNVPVCLLMAYSCFNSEDYDSVVKFAEEMENLDFYILAAQMYIKFGKTNFAEIVLEKMKAINPEDVSTVIVAAWISIVTADTQMLKESCQNMQDIIESVDNSSYILHLEAICNALLDSGSETSEYIDEAYELLGESCNRKMIEGVLTYNHHALAVSSGQKNRENLKSSQCFEEEKKMLVAKFEKLAKN
ncbi:hypothetical protein MHBO_000246 [Bonamia ostreae]|uniref:Coatomer subunit epsilon n=1 Tax=Bonamia ostreae TaxID=126728 RepID=A0ABV2AFU4_9EUKA